MADASIYSMIRPAVAPPDPIQQMGQAMNIKALMGQQSTQDLQRQQLQKSIEDEAATESAYRQSGGDPVKLRELLTGSGRYKQLQALDKLELEKRGKEATIGKDTAAAGASNWKVQLEKLQHGAALLDAAKDPASFDMVLAVGERASVFAPKVVAQLRQQGYSPQLVQSLQAAGLTRAQQLEQQHKAETLALDAANKPFKADGTPNAPVQSFQLDKAKKGATNVSVKTDVKTGESLAAQVGPMMRDSTTAAEGAVKQVDAARRIVQAVDSGKIISGPTADARLVGAQVADALGLGGQDGPEKIANTRAALRGLAELTLQGRQQMRGQGAITESEGKLAEKAMSGEISFTAAEIKQLAQASERAARFVFKEHERKMKVMQENPDLSRVAPFYQGPAMPDETPAAAPVRRYNPATGRIE